MLTHLNEISVLVVALLGVAVGSIWYSPLLFGRIWMRSLGKPEFSADFNCHEMVRAVLALLVVQILFFSVFSWGAVHLGTAQSLFSFVGFVWTLLFLFFVGIAVWEKRSWTYTIIHGGYLLLVLFGGGAVIVYWPW